YARTERERSLGPLWAVERRFIQETRDLAVRGNGRSTAAEILAVRVRKEEGNRGSRIIRIGDSQTGVGGTGDLGIDSSSARRHSARNSRLPTKHSVSSIAEDRKTGRSRLLPCRRKQWSRADLHCWPATGREDLAAT